MSMSFRLYEYLQSRGTLYDVRMHEHSDSSAETARSANIRAGQLAKPVILEDEDGAVMAVVPADRTVRIARLARLLGRRGLRLCPEERLSSMFEDCELGAVPPVGMVWDMPTVVDAELDAAEMVYLEAGDHEQLLRMSREQFRTLMGTAKHAQICTRSRFNL
jgi:Ala-tRNA(Pro) deacylase